MAAFYLLSLASLAQAMAVVGIFLSPLKSSLSFSCLRRLRLLLF